MKKMSVATMNRFADALARFPSFNVLSVEAINRIEKAFSSEKVLTLAESCITIDYKVSLKYWKENLNKASETVEILKRSGADANSIKKAEMKLKKIEASEPILNTETYYVFGYILQNFFGVLPSCIVPVEAWKKAFRLRDLLYSPEDFGRNGKREEVKDRLSLYTVEGKTKTVWSEFSAHKAGKKDITDKTEGLHYEKKTGVGDWYTSKRCKTFESIRRELERKENDRIRWDYEKRIVKEATKRKPERVITLSIHWEKTWIEFFRILEEYNGDIMTWFKPLVYTENGCLLQMQEVQSSEKKIEYLMQFNDK